MFRLRTEQHVASLNMTFYKCAVKLLFSLPIIFCKSSLIRPPKLVYLKYTSRIQTVNCFFRGGEVLPIKGHRPRACGWEAYLPKNYIRRSGARHQPLPYWQFLGRTPYIIPLLRRPFSSGCTPRAFGALFTRFPFGVARCLKITTLTRVQSFVGSMLSVKS